MEKIKCTRNKINNNKILRNENCYDSFQFFFIKKIKKRKIMNKDENKI